MTSPRPMESAAGMQPQPGMAVFTSDGHELGTVKTCENQAFKVDAPMRRDYWLSFASIQAIDPGAIRMDFDEASLDAFKLEEPAGQASDSPILDAQKDQFATTEDRELARDRQMHPPRD